LASIPQDIAIEGKEAGLDDRRPGVMLQFSRKGVVELGLLPRMGKRKR
jgi:hypothetical protein